MGRHAISFADCEKITRDSFADECDINRIVDHYARTGMVNHIPRVEPQYGEAPDLTFHEAACIAAETASLVEEGWEATPAEKTPSEAAEAVSEPEQAPAPQDSAPVESDAE